MQQSGFNPIELAKKLRPKMIDLENQKVLLSVLAGTEQEKDLTKDRFYEDVFRSKIYTRPEEREADPFRGEPAGVAAEKLSAPEGQLVHPDECNEVFLGQISGCNLRCWYCYEDRVCNSANHKYGKFFSAEEYLVQFLIESRKRQLLKDRNKNLNILRISGGEVFIVPEFIVWMVEAIEKFGLQDSIYVWVDCNLSTGDFYWRQLTPKQREKIRNFKNLGVCVCHKGFDSQTFHENTGAAPEFYDEQFRMHRRLVEEGLDVYSYLYPVSELGKGLRGRISMFMDQLEHEVDIFAPLRMATPPVKIYGPVKKRLTQARERALENQWEAMIIWQQELKRRFSDNLLKLKPHEVKY